MSETVATPEAQSNMAAFDALGTLVEDYLDGSVTVTDQYWSNDAETKNNPVISIDGLSPYDAFLLMAEMDPELVDPALVNDAAQIFTDTLNGTWVDTKNHFDHHPLHDLYAMVNIQKVVPGARSTYDRHSVPDGDSYLVAGHEEPSHISREQITDERGEQIIVEKRHNIGTGISVQLMLKEGAQKSEFADELYVGVSTHEHRPLQLTTEAGDDIALSTLVLRLRPEDYAYVLDRGAEDDGSNIEGVALSEESSALLHRIITGQPVEEVSSE